jgi:hypothetical protein
VNGGVIAGVIIGMLLLFAAFAFLGYKRRWFGSILSRGKSKDITRQPAFAFNNNEEDEMDDDEALLSL